MNIELFQAPNLNQVSHMISDVQHLAHQYATMTKANIDHSKVLQKVVNDNDQYITQMQQLGPSDKEERRFFRELKIVQETMRQKAADLKNEADEMIKLELKLKSHQDDRSLKLTQLDHQYKLSRNKLDIQTQLVEENKLAYHKVMFRMEQLDIKSNLATKDILKDTKRQVDDLQLKANKLFDKYSDQLNKWQLKSQAAKKLSNEYKNGYLAREAARACVVLEVLQKGAELMTSERQDKSDQWKIPALFRDIVFNKIDGRLLIKEKVVKKDHIQIPLFEEYKHEKGKSHLYNEARANIEMEDMVSHLKHKQGNATVDEVKAANKKMKNAATLYVVTKYHTSDSVKDLQLKGGEFLKQLLPANVSGFAYGQIMHVLPSRRKKGFYPESNTVLATDAADVKVEYKHKQVFKETAKTSATKLDKENNQAGTNPFVDTESDDEEHIDLAPKKETKRVVDISLSCRLGRPNHVEYKGNNKDLLGKSVDYTSHINTTSEDTDITSKDADITTKEFESSRDGPLITRFKRRSFQNSRSDVF